MIEFFRYDRWDGYIGPIADVTDYTYKAEAGGENSLTLVTRGDLAKGDRIVWRDDQGIYHEHVANEPTATRDGDGGVVYQTYCEDAMNEMFRDPVGEVRIRGGSAREALTRILESTRWEVGTVNVTGARTKSFYHISAGEALQDIVSTWGGECYSSFTVDDFGVTHRYVNLVQAMGSRNTHKRFEYGKDLVSVKRTVSADDVYTAMRGYGKGDDLDDDDEGTNGRRITFAEINNGKDYVEDLDALARWGRPDGKGGKAHAFGTVVFSDCEDPAELKELTQQELDDKKNPKVSYECSVIDLAAMGFDYEGVAVGDDVQVVDTAFSPALELEARVMSIELGADPAASKVTIGNIREGIGSELASINSSLSTIRGQSSAWDAAVTFGEVYLQKVIDSLNARFDAMGSYLAFSFEQGLTVASVPLDASGKPTTTPASAINLRGGGFRIASTVKADGSFDWRTFGTGEGFVADYIIAGSLMAGLVNTGVLLVGSADDPVLMADFDSGKVIIKGSSVTIGTSNAEDAIAGLETGVDAAMAVFGYCKTAGATRDKEVSIAGFSLREGCVVNVRFQHANTATSPRLNVSGTGAKSILLDNASLGSENFWGDNQLLTFVYSGGYWHVVDSGSHALIQALGDSITLQVQGVRDDLSKVQSSVTLLDNRVTTEVNSLQDDIDDAVAKQTRYGTCSTAAATQEKDVNMSGDFKLAAGVMVTVQFTYANTATYPRLNVADTGARYIYVGNSLMTQDYWWRAGTTVTFVYTGSYWRVCDSGALARITVAEGEIELRVEKGTLSSEISAEAGLVSIKTNRFEWDSSYSSLSRYGQLEAQSASIKGTFECGSTYGIRLNSSGQMAGLRNGSQVGYIDYSASMRYIPTGEILYGIQVQSNGMIRFSSPHVSALASSDTSQTSTRTSTGSIWVAGFDNRPGEGWDLNSLVAYELSFINGFCTSGNVN